MNETKAEELLGLFTQLKQTDEMIAVLQNGLADLKNNLDCIQGILEKNYPECFAEFNKNKRG